MLLVGELVGSIDDDSVDSDGGGSDGCGGFLHVVLWCHDLGVVLNSS